MAGLRKLNGEIERCLKQVAERVEIFNDVWDKVSGLTPPTLLPLNVPSVVCPTDPPQVNETIFHQGYAVVHNLQLLKVDFKQNYEETITNIQLQEQLKVTKNYALDVTRVVGAALRARKRSPLSTRLPTPDTRLLLLPALLPAPPLCACAQLKEVDILQSKTEADIALISATAKRDATVLVNQAEADALRLEQSTKSKW